MKKSNKLSTYKVPDDPPFMALDHHPSTPISNTTSSSSTTLINQLSQTQTHLDSTHQNSIKMSGIVNKIKEAVHSDKDKTHSQPEGTHGTHNSRAANAADPRIDSDRDHRAAPHTGAHTTGTHTGTTGSGLTGTHTTGTHTGTTGSGLTGTHGTHTTGTHQSGIPGTSGGHGLNEGAVGPHSSSAMNAADPRVDSDLDRTRGTHTGTGMTGTHGTTGGLTGTHGTHGTTGSGLTGTHTTGTHTGMAGTGAHGHNAGIPGTSGGHGLNEGAVGPHSSSAMNAADPRVDSDLDRTRGTHTGAHTGTGMTGAHGTHGHVTGSGPGPAPHTAGPHKQDMGLFSPLNTQKISDC